MSCSTEHELVDGLQFYRVCVAAILNSKKVDPEELLTDLGFKGVDNSLLHKLPPRFLSSQLQDKQLFEQFFSLYPELKNNGETELSAVVNRMLHRLPSCYHDNDLPERRTSLHRELAAALSSKQVSSNTLLEAWMSSPSYTPPPSPVTSKPISNLWAHTLSAIKETEASSERKFMPQLSAESLASRDITDESSEGEISPIRLNCRVPEFTFPDPQCSASDCLEEVFTEAKDVSMESEKTSQETNDYNTNYGIEASFSQITDIKLMNSASAELIDSECNLDTGINITDANMCKEKTSKDNEVSLNHIQSDWLSTQHTLKDHPINSSLVDSVELLTTTGTQRKTCHHRTLCNADSLLHQHSVGTDLTMVKASKTTIGFNVDTTAESKITGVNVHNGTTLVRNTRYRICSAANTQKSRSSGSSSLIAEESSTADVQCRCSSQNSCSASESLTITQH